MSKETRNSEFSRKSGKSRRRDQSRQNTASNTADSSRPPNPSSARRFKSTAAAKTPPNRARGTHKITAVAAPRSPKSRHLEKQGPEKQRSERQETGTQRQKTSSRDGRERKNGHERKGGREGGAMWIWGAHAVMAVLNNPKRTLHTLMMTESAEARLDIPKTAPLPKIVLPNIMDKQFPSGTVHQGIAVKVAPLEWPDISDIAAEHSDHDGLILVLDQITDPHNVGAMLRLCSAFGVRALVMQDRKAPPMAGATAKVAVGCLETIPVCLVKNIANTLQDLKKQNWMVTGLAGETERELSSALKGSGNKVIVMGAEGPGLRPRVRDCCDWVARIPMLSSDVHGEAESLNVATAAGIALYEARRA